MNLYSNIKREYPTQPLLGVSIMCWKQNQVLLIKRAQEPYKGLWSLPGGLIELGESLVEAAKRELQEETNITAQITEQLETFDSIQRDKGGKLKFHYVLVVFKAKFLAGDEIAKDDATEVKWYTIDQLINLKLTPNTKQCIERNIPTKSQ